MPSAAVGPSSLIEQSATPLEQSAAAPRKSQPAWAISIGLHCLAVVVLGLTLGLQHEPIPDEPDRPAGIVLVERSALKPSEYFQESLSENPSNTLASSEFSPLSHLPEPESGHGNPAADANVPTPLPGLASSAEITLGLGAASSLPVTRSKNRFPVQDDSDILDNDPVRNRPPGPQGPLAQVAPFGLKAQGRDFVFLIDRSHSMGNRGLGGMDTAAREVARTIDQLEPHHRFQIIAYNQKLHYFRPKGLTPAVDKNKLLAKQFLNSLVASGGTEHDMALRAGLRRKPDVLFLFTDGDEPPLSSGQIRRIVSDNQAQASIHTFLFGSGPLQNGNHFLRRLAKLNQGQFVYLDVLQLGRTR